MCGFVMFMTLSAIYVDPVFSTLVIFIKKNNSVFDVINDTKFT